MLGVVMGQAFNFSVNKNFRYSSTGEVQTHKGLTIMVKRCKSKWRVRASRMIWRESWIDEYVGWGRHKDRTRATQLALVKLDLKLEKEPTTV